MEAVESCYVLNEDPKMSFTAADFMMQLKLC